MLMQSSTSFPSDQRFTLLEVRVDTLPVRAGCFEDQVFVRFRLTEVESMDVFDAVYDKKLAVQAVIEAAPRSWTQADRIGTTVYLCKGMVVLGVDMSDAPDPQGVVEQAVHFATAQLNDPLETAATLYGIRNNLDVFIEHKLRPDRGTLAQAKLSHLLNKRKPSPPFFKFTK